MAEQVPPSGIALKKLLDEGGAEADAIKKAVHRTQIWRFTTGRGRPDADNVALLERLSGGRVPAGGWGAPGATSEAHP